MASKAENTFDLHRRSLVALGPNDWCFLECSTSLRPRVLGPWKGSAAVKDNHLGSGQPLGTSTYWSWLRFPGKVLLILANLGHTSCRIVLFRQYVLTILGSATRLLLVQSLDPFSSGCLLRLPTPGCQYSPPTVGSQNSVHSSRNSISRARRKRGALPSGSVSWASV